MFYAQDLCIPSYKVSVLGAMAEADILYSYGLKKHRGISLHGTTRGFSKPTTDTSIPFRELIQYAIS